MLPLFSRASIWPKLLLFHPRFSHSALKYRNQVAACSFGTSKRMGQLPCSKRRSCTFANPPVRQS
jgi:hypothetical protein